MLTNKNFSPTLSSFVVMILVGCALFCKACSVFLTIAFCTSSCHFWCLLSYVSLSQCILNLLLFSSLIHCLFMRIFFNWHILINFSLKIYVCVYMRLVYVVLFTWMFRAGYSRIRRVHWRPWTGSCRPLMLASCLGCWKPSPGPMLSKESQASSTAQPSLQILISKIYEFII